MLALLFRGKKRAPFAWCSARAEKCGLQVSGSIHGYAGGACEGGEADHVNGRTPFHRQLAGCLSGRRSMLADPYGELKLP